ncbi:MAG: hypothetical protein JRI46_03845 [Deltaproteobacteria bacterium]|nr:hypothetical protein [Deltaproteobacteria bacterium]
MGKVKLGRSLMGHPSVLGDGPQRASCPRAKLLGRVSRKGKAPPANPERVTEKALKRGDKGSYSPDK